MSLDAGRLAYSPREAADAVGLSESTIRKAYLDPDSGLDAVRVGGSVRINNAGKPIRVGGSVRITRAALEAWLAGQPKAR